MRQQPPHPRLYWRGKDLDDLSRDELLEIVMYMNHQITLAMDATDKLVRMHEAARHWQEKTPAY